MRDWKGCLVKYFEGKQIKGGNHEKKKVGSSQECLSYLIPPNLIILVMCIM